MMAEDDRIGWFGYLDCFGYYIEPRASIFLCLLLLFVCLPLWHLHILNVRGRLVARFIAIRVVRQGGETPPERKLYR